MKFKIYILCAAAASILFTGCETSKEERVTLSKYTMHGNDSIVPVYPKKVADIKALPERKLFKEVPTTVLTKYRDKIPAETRQYNIQIADCRVNSQNLAQDQDKIVKEYLWAVVDYELKQIGYKPNTSWLETGIKRLNTPIPQIRYVAEAKMRNSPRVSIRQIRKFNILRHKVDNMQAVDNLITDLFRQCGLNESDKYWFKKFIVLRCEYIGSVWHMYNENETMRGSL